MTPCAIAIGEGFACGRTDVHSHCALCGLSYSGDVALCNHHVYGAADWAEGNRAMCALLHRGIVPPPPPPVAPEIVHEWADVA